MSADRDNPRAGDDRYRYSPRLVKRTERFLARRITFALATLVRRLSLKGSYALADRVGSLLYYAHPRLRHTALKNLKIAFGEDENKGRLARTARRSFEYLCRSLVEVLKMASLSPSDLLDWVRIECEEYLSNALAEQRGVILLTAHYGNWELMGARLCSAGFPLWVVARDQRDMKMTGLINDVRERFGMKVIRRGDARGLLRCLRGNGILGILSDQNEVSGVPVDFFGLPAATATGAAVLAMRTGAPVVPGFISRDEENRHCIRFQPPLQLAQTGDWDEDVLANTQLMTKVIEDAIRRDPEQWMWLHRRWKLSDRKNAEAIPDRQSAEP